MCQPDKLRQASAYAIPTSGHQVSTVSKMNATWSVIVCLLCVCFCHTGEGIKTESNPRMKQVQPDNFKKLNVLVMAVPASGHTSVPLALGEELVRRGHNVEFVTSSEKYRSNAEKANVTFKRNGYTYGMIDIVKANQGNMMQTVVNHLTKFIRNETTNFLQFFKEQNASKETWDIVISTEVL